MSTHEIFIQQSRFEEFQTPALALVGEKLLQEFSAQFPAVSVAVIETGQDSAGQPKVLLAAFLDGHVAGLCRFGLDPSVPATQPRSNLTHSPIRVFDQVRHGLLSDAADLPADAALAMGIDILVSRFANLLEYTTVTHRVRQMAILLEIDAILEIYLHKERQQLRSAMAIVDWPEHDSERPYKEEDSPGKDRLSMLRQTITQLFNESRDLSDAIYTLNYGVVDIHAVRDDTTRFAGLIGIAEFFRVLIPRPLLRFRVCAIAEMILHSLLTNSKEALVGSCKGLPYRAPFIELEVSFHLVSKQVVFSVTDNGAGMSPDARERLFSPFFSTKGEGRGRGLYLSKRLAESLGGSLSLVYSDPAIGTRFALRLPVSVAS